jgi:SM-20-related protein
MYPSAYEAPLDLGTIRTAPLDRLPWTYSVIDASYTNPGVARELTDTFPQAGFTAVSQTTVDKQFATEVRNDIDGDDMHPVWRALLRQVNTPEYCAALAQLVGLDLSGAIVRAAFWRYGPNCWLSPHADDESKVLSHVLYFNHDWPSQAGGHLLINASKDVTDVHRRVAPQAGTSLVIVRSDTSWHSVEPVHPAHARTRQSMTVVFHKPGYDLSYYGH